jgi:hypothetical protein
MMAVLNFETAIYWGQLSKCIESSVNISQYSCKFSFIYKLISLLNCYY